MDAIPVENLPAALLQPVISFLAGLKILELPRFLNSQALPDEPFELMFWREWPVKSSKGNRELATDFSWTWALWTE
jgi:hypothetical protein